jgi:nucleoside-diphosphate-sugar epimerase
VLDKFLYGEESLKEIKSDNLRIFKGDTRHIEDIKTAINNVDAVVHLAELVGDPACALDTSTTQDVNYFATKTIASICKHYQINRLIYASSCSVYGASDNNLLTEESALNPVSLYAKMKVSAEQALIEMRDDNFLPTILRLSTVFGVSHRPRFDLVINLLTAKALKEGKITIFGGDQWRPNVHVKDVAKSIISILESPLDNVGGEIFNIGNKENNMTINQIGKLIKKQTPEAELVIEKKLVDKRNYKVDFSKYEKAVNDKIKTTISDGILELIKFIEKNPNFNYKLKKYSNIKYLQEINNE